MKTDLLLNQILISHKNKCFLFRLEGSCIIRCSPQTTLSVTWAVDVILKHCIEIANKYVIKLVIQSFNIKQNFEICALSSKNNYNEDH